MSEPKQITFEARRWQGDRVVSTTTVTASSLWEALLAAIELLGASNDRVTLDRVKLQ